MELPIDKLGMSLPVANLRFSQEKVKAKLREILDRNKPTEKAEVPKLLRDHATMLPYVDRIPRGKLISFAFLVIGQTYTGDDLLMDGISSYPPGSEGRIQDLANWYAEHPEETPFVEV